jgi:uncharacterized protein
VSRRAYLDSSALVKLVVREAESATLRADLRLRPALISSRLGAVETERAIRRTDPSLTAQLRAVLEVVDLIELTPALLAQAATLAPPDLRTLDALHLATLLLLGATEVDVITYDDRLAAAARGQGFTVVRPGWAQGSNSKDDDSAG